MYTITELGNDDNKDAKVIICNVASGEDIWRLVCYLGNRYYFRGQGDVAWALTTSYERAHNAIKEEDTLRGNALSEYADEYNAINYYKKITSIESKDNILTLAELQHFGAQTRLLDITNSFLVALFFAFEEYRNNARAIWAFNKQSFNYSCSSVVLMQMGDCKNFSEEESGDFYCDTQCDILKNINQFKLECINAANKKIQDDQEGYVSQNTHDDIIPLEIICDNYRLNAQNGAFLFPTTFNPFEQVLAKTLQLPENELKNCVDVEITATQFVENMKLFRNTDIIKIVIPIKLRSQVEIILQ